MYWVNTPKLMKSASLVPFENSAAVRGMSFPPLGSRRRILRYALNEQYWALPAGIGALPAGKEALPAGNAFLPAGIDPLPAGKTVLPAGKAASFAEHGSSPAGKASASPDQGPERFTALHF